MSKMKIFVSAYACEPNLGTEMGVGWHWILEMSKYFELWVLTRESNRSNIENWMLESDKEYNIHFVYYDLPKVLRFWKKGLRGVRTYYVIWQCLTNKIVKSVMSQNDIQVYHLLTYGNSLWPASSYGMKKFFIWGPTGGVDSIPKEYSKLYKLKSRIIEFIRRFVVKTLPFNIGFNRRCKHADLIFCKSYSMYENIPIRYREKAMLFTDVAVELKEFVKKDKKDTRNDIIKYIAVGRLDAWRGFDILIEAFAKASVKNSNIRLNIIGDGSDRDRLIKKINSLDMNEIIYMDGEVSRDTYYEKLQSTDVVINSCLKEGAVTVAFDSMAASKPLICIDTGGYTRYFNSEYSVVLDRVNREDLILNMSDAILKMTNSELRLKMGQKAFEAGCNYTWSQKGKLIYEEIMRAYEKRNM